MLRLNGILRRVSQTKLFLEYRLVAFGSKLGSKLQFKHSSVLVRMIRVVTDPSGNVLFARLLIAY